MGPPHRPARALPWPRRPVRRGPTAPSGRLSFAYFFARKPKLQRIVANSHSRLCGRKTPERKELSGGESFIETACQHLLLLVGFDILIYRKYYDTPPILVGHQWDREENEKLAKENNVAKVWTITTTSNVDDSHVATPPTIYGKIIGVGNVSTPSTKRTKLPEIAKTAETACDKTAEIFSNIGDNDPIAVDHNGLDFDDCHISEVIKFLQKLARSPNASAINLAFTKHITNALIKAREEKLKLETSIPRKLEDGWEPIIKMRVNDFDCNALCDLGASISVMPKKLYDMLDLPPLKNCYLDVNLADNAIKKPLGRIDNVRIMVNNNLVPVDFVVLDIECNASCPIILGRPFLRTVGAIIDMKEGSTLAPESLVLRRTTLRRHQPSTCFLAPPGSINLGFFLRENLLLSASHLPLGVPNGRVSTARIKHRTEHYLDYDYDTMMEHRTEHYLDYDIDTMVEPSFDTTLHKTEDLHDGATMRVLMHMIIYVELVLWNKKSVPAMIAIDTLLRAQKGATIKVPSYMNHHLGMPRIVINTRRLMIVVDHHHLMTAIDMRHHMIIADTSHLMFAIDPHLPRIFDDTPQDMVMMQEYESLDMKRPRLERQDATPTNKMVPSATKEEPHLMVLPSPTATTTMAPTRSLSPKMKTMESTLQDEGRSTQLYANMTMICPPRPRSSQCFRCTQDGHHLWECPNLHCDVCTSNKHMTWECNTPQAHKLYFAQLDAQFANMTLQDTIVFKEWCKEMDKMTTMKTTLQDGAREGQVKSDVDSSLALNNTIAPSNGVNMGGDGVEKVEHGIFPSTKEANGVENGEHGMIPSPMEAHGDEKIEPTPICLNDEMVSIPCEHESHLAHLSASDSELSDSHPICEFECFHLEDMSDTPSSMDDEFPIMEKMYMVHEDDDITPCLQEVKDVDHMDPTTSTTPTSNESDYKGIMVVGASSSDGSGAA
ncbi:hypothetical protein QYE76_041812 [Lolium multiflorum]|uniref:CCHC-type domain-containing protein n=1 Tax=Lolium multiflorum TaxID=4521 RepID=A0AAD8TE32_LOLMU|nr:hypothetical protein QYE76_041812 [Lolium multiflorum]